MEEKKVDKVDPHWRPVEVVEKALRDSRGLISFAAKKLRMTHSGVYKRIAENPELQQVQKDIREKLLDDVEGALHSKAITKKDMKAIAYYLDAQGKSRGYGKTLNLPPGLEIVFGIKTSDTEDLSERPPTYEVAPEREMIEE